MATSAPTEPDLSRLEEAAAEHLAEEASSPPAEPEEPAAELERVEPPPPLRTAVALAFPVLGVAVMFGGIFNGTSPRFYAAIAGLLGIGLAILADRVERPMRSTVAIVGGIVLIGLVMVLPSGLNYVFELRRILGEAAEAGNLLRPPVPFTVGWRAVIGWVMGVVGFQSGWVALRMRRPAMAFLFTLPMMAISAISIPELAKVASGLIALALFAIGLDIASTTSTGSEEESVPFSYQLRKIARGLPLVGIVTLAVFLLAQTDFLLPDPLVDPAQEAQKPKAVPLSAAEDRVLFEVRSSVSGPWRIGSLDVYDGRDWRLPPFAQNQIEEVPESGVIDPTLEPGVRATFTIAGLRGAVLPTLPNAVGLISRGPLLAYDSRNDNIRLVEGQVQPGLTYVVTAAGLPSVDDLRAITDMPPRQIQQFLQIGPPPPAAASLISTAPKNSKWDEFDFLRTYLLENVVAAGSGTPISITPERVDDMISGSKEASPFEIVAAQAMMARWINVPSRIGYGFDGGDQTGEVMEVRPSHGSAFVEVYFPGYRWLPVIGTPKKAKASTTTGQQRVDPNILPSEDIAVRLVFPVETPAPAIFGQQVKRVLLIVVPTALLLFLGYIIWPAIRKAVIRSRRKARARAEGPAARIASAYSEWRDVATDLGCFHPSDTPFIFLRRFGPDEEHAELAWLTTRALWGDLRVASDSELAAHAEELSRSLKRRMTMAQPPTIRSVALVSRLSLRHPYAQGNGHARR